MKVEAAQETLFANLACQAHSTTVHGRLGDGIWTEVAGGAQAVDADALHLAGGVGVECVAGESRG